MLVAWKDHWKSRVPKATANDGGGPSSAQHAPGCSRCTWSRIESSSASKTRVGVGRVEYFLSKMSLALHLNAHYSMVFYLRGSWTHTVKQQRRRRRCLSQCWVLREEAFMNTRSITLRSFPNWRRSLRAPCRRHLQSCRFCSFADCARKVQKAQKVQAGPWRDSEGLRQHGSPPFSHMAPPLLADPVESPGLPIPTLEALHQRRMRTNMMVPNILLWGAC